MAKRNPGGGSNVEKLKALEAKATKGPWVSGDCVRPTLVLYRACPTPTEDLCAHCYCDGEGSGRNNMKFIAAARNALPALLAVAEAAAEYQRTSRDVMKGTAGMLNLKGAGEALDAALTALETLKL